MYIYIYKYTYIYVYIYIYIYIMSCKEVVDLQLKSEYFSYFSQRTHNIEIQ